MGLRSFAAKLFGPLVSALSRRIPSGDPWHRLETSPRVSAFGRGARRDFAEYLRGESTVRVASLEDIQDWLLGCSYESDDALFAEPDFWQHPVTFERLRAGDCEDFALWAWRKLNELGMDSEFVVGFALKDGQPDGSHAWVMVRLDGVEYLFETTARAKDRMLRPLAEVKRDYLPQFGVGRGNKRFSFSGSAVSVPRPLVR